MIARARILAGLVLSLLTAQPLMAEGSALETLSRRDQMLGWEAVGRIDINGSSFCTGTLIATDLVLTAAHCVFDGGGRPVDPGKIIFSAGYAGGTSIAESPAAMTVAHPAYRADAPVSPENVRHDVALLKLARPIPAGMAAPFAIRAPGKGDSISVVSYASGREEVLSWQRECSVLGRAEGLIAMDCDVTFGASGAPVLDRSGARARIVSIVSAGGPTDQGMIAYGMDLPGVVGELKKLLAAGDVLATAQGEAAAAMPKVRRLGIGTGETRDIGARFLTP